MIKVNDKIKVHMYSNSEEIQTRHKDTVFTVREQNGQLGIDWNTERSPYTCNGDVFAPFYTFAHTVIFENVETKEKYHFSNLANAVVEVQ